MVSPRRTAAAAVSAGATTWLAELLWRDWFKYLLHHHPDLADRTLDPGLERLEWDDDDDAFAAWTRGETGYGLVDAGMRQLAQTGEQPNRVRMVCASFLTRDLHLDWRRGELWYREHLVDGDLSANAGNWQWVAGTGIDAAPWFRVMSPILQERRFDPAGRLRRSMGAGSPCADRRPRRRARARSRPLPAGAGGGGHAALSRSSSSGVELEAGHRQQLRELLGRAGAGDRRRHRRLARGARPARPPTIVVDVRGGDLVERGEHARPRSSR